MPCFRSFEILWVETFWTRKVCENAVCGKQYCWICLQPWEGHGSYFNCRNPRIGDAAKNSRFLFCYERFLDHANGMEAAAKRRANWLEVAQPAGVPKPAGHWIAKAADLMEKYETTLMWSYVFCFYLAPACWAQFRRQQEPLENFVGKLKSQVGRRRHCKHVCRSHVQCRSYQLCSLADRGSSKGRLASMAAPEHLHCRPDPASNSYVC